jgi:hypothetical protein
MKQLLLRIFIGITCLAAPAGVTAAVTRPAPLLAPDGERFLFIADISEDMERLKAENEAALYDLLLAGLYGQMRDGDSYGLWAFNKETYTGRFPMQVWDARKRSQLATIAAAFLAGHNYEKSSDTKQMITQLATVIQAVSNLTVFIISDGSSVMHGTPFDKKIADEYKRKRRERSAAKRPFVTTLIVRDGRMVDYSVVVAGQPIQLPPRSLPMATARAAPLDRPPGNLLSNTPVGAPGAAAPAASTQLPTNWLALAEPAAAAASAAPTNVFSDTTNLIARSEAVPSPEASVPPRRAPVMQIVTRSNSLPAALNPIPSTLAETNGLAVSPPSPSATTPAFVALAAITAAELKPNAAGESLRSLLPPTITVAARERAAETVKPEPPGAIEATALPSSRPAGESWMLTFAVVLLALVLMLLLVVLRRLRPTPGSSLITQSMERR